MTKVLALVMFYFLKLIGHITLVLPFELKSFVASFFTFLWWDLVKFRRRIILTNLIHVFPRTSEETMDHFKKRILELGKKNIWHSCYAVVELIERFAWSESTVNKKVRVQNLQVLKDLQSKNQGFFILTAHLGSWELATFSGVCFGLKVAVVTKFLRSKFWDHVWVLSRRQFGLKLLGESKSGFSIVKAIREGYAVGFMMDQHTGLPHGIESKFLGLKAWTPKGLAVLAEATKAPIFEIYMLRTAQGYYDLKIEPLQLSRTESGHSKDERVALHVNACNEKMEQWIRRFPEQYLWLHRRFKNVLDYKANLPWEFS